MIDRVVSLPKEKSFFLFGPRQTGKSTLINARFTQNVWTIDLLLSDTLLKYSKEPAVFRTEAIEKISSQKIRVIFLDEIQRLPILLNEVQHLMSHYPVQFILTGSSARKLKRGGANLLAARALEYELFPLVYREIAGRIKLEDALRYGTLPVVFTEDPETKTAILSAYVNTYLREEIQAEGLARNLGGFARFLDIAADQSGELLSFSSMARECRLSIRTTQSYFEILEDTLIGFRLMPWRKSLRKRLVAHPKFYLFDTGVTNAISKRLKAPFDRAVTGKLFEQWIILETYRYLKYSRSEANLYFWRSNIGTEVDLLIEQYGKIIGAFEIKSTPHLANAHLAGLRSFHEEHPRVPCYLIGTADNAREMAGVKILPWREYLDSLPQFIH